jgi:hypothetical protein
MVRSAAAVARMFITVLMPEPFRKPGGWGPGPEKRSRVR